MQWDQRKTSKSQGRLPVIPKAAEQELTSGTRAMEIWCWHLNRKEVIEIVALYIQKNNKTNPFKENVPGEEWFLVFQRWHNLPKKYTVTGIFPQTGN